MKNSMSVLVPAVVVGIILTVGLQTQAYAEQQADQAFQNSCWVFGGTVVDGKCKPPEDKRGPEEKVCNAMRGNWVIWKTEAGTEVKCYTNGGVEIALPDLTGKEVVDHGDGTVILYDVKSK